MAVARLPQDPRHFPTKNPWLAEMAEKIGIVISMNNLDALKELVKN